ncbi:dihydroorotase [Leucothrix sargassi]|nr:dihydroorotase [Leucothrix sargassi]
MSTLLICNARIVNEGSTTEGDIFVRDGLIESLGSDLSHLPSDRFIDAKGLLLLPGMIDTQFTLAAANFSEERLIQETHAAVAGGVTSVMLLPNLNSEISTGLPNKKQTQQLTPKLINNLALYQVAKSGGSDDLSELSVLSHICALFVSMVSLSDSYRVDSDNELENIIANSPILVAIEADDMPSILENEESYRQIYGDNIPVQLHSTIRGVKSCADSVERVLSISDALKKRIHLLHVSCTEEIELIESARRHNSLVSADVCSHFLTFSSSDYEQKAHFLKYNPAIKSDIDRAALVQGLFDHNITSICTGHVPYSKKEKRGGYFDIKPGMPQAQFALPAILEHYQDEIFNIEDIVEKTSHAVAECFGIKNRGYIREGYWADFVLVDPDESFISRNEDVLSVAGWTIYSGNEFRSSIVKTIVNGEVVYSRKGGDTVSGAGQLLEFKR